VFHCPSTAQELDAARVLHVLQSSFQQSLTAHNVLSCPAAQEPDGQCGGAIFFRAAIRFLIMSACYVFPAPQPKNLMVSAGARSKDYDKSRYISILNIIQVSLGFWSPCVSLVGGIVQHRPCGVAANCCRPDCVFTPLLQIVTRTARCVVSAG